MSIFEGAGANSFFFCSKMMVAIFIAHLHYTPVHFKLVTLVTIQGHLETSRAHKNNIRNGKKIKFLVQINS